MIERQEMRRHVILIKNSLHVCAAAGTPAPHRLISESCDARLKLSAHLHFASFLSIHSYTSACSARSSATRSCQVHRHFPLPFPPATSPRVFYSKHPKRFLLLGPITANPQKSYLIAIPLKSYLFSEIVGFYTLNPFNKVELKSLHKS